jgi:magnesium transporter
MEAPHESFPNPPTLRAQTRLSPATRLVQRLPLHALTVLGGLTSAWLLAHALPDDAPAAADLLRYVPIVLGLSANVGVQSSTIVVRGLATGEIGRDRTARAARGEIAVGALTGIACGAAAALAAYALEGADAAALALALSLAAALAVALTWSACLGTGVPVLFARLGLDPAVAAGPVLIMLGDVSAAGLFVLAGELVRGAV